MNSIGGEIMSILRALEYLQAALAPLIIWYSYETNRLRHEAEKSRKVLFMPILKFGHKGIESDVQVTNIGYGPAFNVLSAAHISDKNYASSIHEKLRIIAKDETASLNLKPIDSKPILWQTIQALDLDKRETYFLVTYEDCMGNKYLTAERKPAEFISTEFRPIKRKSFPAVCLTRIVRIFSRLAHKSLLTLHSTAVYATMRRRNHFIDWNSLCGVAKRSFPVSK
jgi:hypothetical protein